MSEKNSGLRRKLLLLLSVPVMGIIAYSVFLTSIQVTEMMTLNRFDDFVRFSERASALINSLQKERGYSVGHVTSGGENFKSELGEQRTQTDTRFQQVKGFLTDGFYKGLSAGMETRIKEATGMLDGLGQHRQAISGLSIPEGNVAKPYTVIIDNLIQAQIIGANAAPDATVSSMMLAALSVSQAKEYAGRERAQLANVFTTNVLDSTKLDAFTGQVALQKSFINGFLLEVNNEKRDMYQKTMDHPSVKDVDRVRTLVTSKADKLQIINAIMGKMGYGGMIHNFKNFVIRGTPRHATSTETAVKEVNQLVDQYLALPGVLEYEKALLADIRNTANQYGDALKTVTPMVAANRPVKAIDQVVKISDGPTLEAITRLQTAEMGVTPQEWFKMSSERIELLRTVEKEMVAEIDQFEAGKLRRAYISTAAIVLFALVLTFFTLITATVMIRGLVNRFTTAIDELTNSASQTASNAQQMASASQALAEGASEQAAGLEETSSTLEQVSAMTEQNADNAKQADLLAQEARKEADKGITAMERMNQAIGEIKVSSDETAKIIKSIDEIAFQTNLLALNAAVEAARAGDAGKGFAVVAEEVRNLAQRSAEAARTTSEMIESSQQKSEQGVQAASEVGSVLSGVNESIQKVVDLLQEVSAASGEQARGITQVTAAMSQMDKVTQGNAANAEQTSSVSESLASQAEILQQVVNTISKMVVGNKAGNGQKKLSRKKVASLSMGKPAKKSSAKPAGSLKSKLLAEGPQEDFESLHAETEDLSDQDFEDIR